MFRSTYTIAALLTAAALTAGAPAQPVWAQGQLVYTEPTPPPAKVPETAGATAQEITRLKELREQWAKAHANATAAIDANEKAEKNATN